MPAFEPWPAASGIRRLLLAGAGCTGLGLAACAGLPGAAAPSLAEQRRELEAAERRFARTMAERDLAAFMAEIAPDAVFLNGGEPLRGPEAIRAFWSRFFRAGPAPFSWEPELAEVLGGGGLGMTLGPVRNPAGATIARFYSVWRREPEGRWRVVFDNGYPLPACPATP